ncbi:alcohol oxidase [Ascobolus immersus RN42]|uniref:Alcohol oxidase n=1 Tax=Ascobolus immersus RN42 TaxID=1160509 RepID=A0A3N4I1T3_ASCIM|nr:alcohol oxidase [Ascobolus immersus RN42]
MVWAFLLKVPNRIPALTDASYGAPVYEKELLKQYDYIIVGGGTSGLVVANRLTEDRYTSVLVIESGPYLDPVPEQILYPGWAQVSMTNNSILSPFRYQSFKSAPIESLSNRSFDVQAGHVVGGSSAVNGMVFDRGSPRDYDDWEKLGNTGWGWNGLLPYFKKSETFTPPSISEQQRRKITYDPSVHGDSGPIHSSYPNGTHLFTTTYLEALHSIGQNVSRDQAGSAVGAFHIPNAIDPSNQTRSFAYTGYLAPIRDKRANLHLIANRVVNRIISSPAKQKNGKVRIVGVEFSASENSKRSIVRANKGVIMAAGALHTPQLLQLSGIGNPELLEKLGIKTVLNLPGVGENFQDHAYIRMQYSLSIPLAETTIGNMSDRTFFDHAYQQYVTNKTGPFAIGMGNSAAFLSLPSVSKSLANQVSSLVATHEEQLDTSTPESVRIGYTKQIEVLAASLRSPDVAALEFLFNGFVSVQRPLSRGHVRINSASAFERPIVSYRTLSHPIDAAVMVAGIKYQRKIYQSPVLAYIKPKDLSQFAGVGDDEEIVKLLRKEMGPSIAHPSGTCGMRPREDGGVVDEKLRVYGAERLWIVDASIIPLVPASHISSTVYAVAEKAADLIKEKY